MNTLRKDVTVLIDQETYNTPNTSLLTFHFEPHLYEDSHTRLSQSQIKHATIDHKDLYIFDHLFSSLEAEEMRSFSETAPFSVHSYGSSEAVAHGEEPARSMNGKERWQFFSRPPQAIHEVYKLLSTMAAHLNADITTLPWVLCDASGHGSPAVIANKLTRSSKESMELGKHQDSNPAQKIAFGIPILYSSSPAFFPTQFSNGTPGNPWLVSVMVYATADNFLPEYKMGTAFYHNDGTAALQIGCAHMRLVFFEGDLFHSIEESNIPQEINTWRVSYVFKLLINPKAADLDLKAAFHAFLCQTSLQFETMLSNAHSLK